MRKRRFQKEDWVHLGLSELSENGAEAVKLEAICKAAGLTRGSFYHHFEDHTAFLIDLAEAWLGLQTETVSHSGNLESVSDAELQGLQASIMDIDFRLEIGMREIARRLKPVADIVQMADSTRLEVLTDIYQRRFALASEAAHELARLEYAVLNGLVLTWPETSTPELDTLAGRYREMVQSFLNPERSVSV